MAKVVTVQKDLTSIRFDFVCGGEFNFPHFFKLVLTLNTAVLTFFKVVTL